MDCLENPMDGGAWWAATYGVTHPGNQVAKEERVEEGDTDRTFTLATGWSLPWLWIGGVTY